MAKSAGKDHDRKDVAVVRCAVVTVSDSRTEADDASGALIEELLRSAGHAAVSRRIVKDSRAEISRCVQVEAERSDVQVVIVTGGTGVAARDVTVEAVEPLYFKRLPGFGELFRSFSADEVGAASALSRASAGLITGAVVYLLPGSPKAVRLAMEKLICPVLGHVTGLTNTSTNDEA